MARDDHPRWLFHHGRAYLYVRDAHVVTVRGKGRCWWVHRPAPKAGKFGPFPSLAVAQSWALSVVP